MSLFFKDQEIEKMIREEKHIPLSGYEALYTLSKQKNQHKEQNVDIERSIDKDSLFQIIIRQSVLNPLDFTVILALAFKNNNQIFKLRRYNGKSHRHHNKLESEKFYDFHIHQATEKYQLEGYNKEEIYAEPTDKYSDLRGAIDLMIKECNIIIPVGAQQSIF